MTQKRIAPYGSWKSPITATAIASESFGLAQVAIDGDDLYWTETRPWEGGRSVIVRQPVDGETSDVTPAGFNVRNRVHEYGGGAFTVHDGVVYFCNDSDQRVYAHRPGEAPTPLTPDDARRYADLEVDHRHNRILCVCEDHSQPDAEPTNTVVAIGIDGGEIETIAQGNDFYSVAPRQSKRRPDLLAGDGTIRTCRGTRRCCGWPALTPTARPSNPRIAAGDAGESIGEPLWSPDGTLYFVSDRTGWWNLYRWDGGESGQPMYARWRRSSQGRSGSSGQRTMDLRQPTRLVSSYTQDGMWRTGRLDATFRSNGAVRSPVHRPGARSAQGRQLAGRRSSPGLPRRPSRSSRLDLKTGAHTVVVESSSLDVAASYFSVPEGIEFPTEGWRDRPCLLLPAHQPRLRGSAQRTTAHDRYQSRRAYRGDFCDTRFGDAILDEQGVRRTRRELRRQHGLRDGVPSSSERALGYRRPRRLRERRSRYAVSSGRADGDRLIVRGSSAGGYTTLACLAFRDVFKAGASYYGIGDLETLARDTHKFESRYLDSLIGPYPAERDIYVSTVAHSLRGRHHLSGDTVSGA